MDIDHSPPGKLSVMRASPVRWVIEFQVMAQFMRLILL
ncbi:hypothetical protein OHAE_1163 [Ochrobactrum soli]|uniref:Uncharacterized protein n=1 Tax=Ochrobactrum soli TaxID=2448455 RepID=A0A2P9HMJ0_9HYPH|nr:hypothetical protein OHAE_1163 [[Ochrobactrum] soli]